MATMAENVIAAASETRPPMLEKGMYGNTNGVTDIRRAKRLEDLKRDGKLSYDSDIKAVNILLLGLPVDIYTLINHYQTAKEIWDRVKELMKGTKMTKQERESMLYDEFDKFTSKPGESIHSYYLRYAKLFNDMNMIPMSMTPMEINTKFVNHLQPEWSRFVTIAKQAKDLHSVKFDQLYAFLKHNERYAKEVREMLQRFRDPLALLANTYNPPPSYNNHIGKNQAIGARVVNTVGDTGTNQLRVIICYNCKGEGYIAKQYNLEENDECEDLQLQATTNSKADHVDAYDSDCDDEAIANAIFMENLSPVGSINGDTVEPRYDFDILSKSYDELTSNNNFISYADYMVTIGNDDDNYVSPPIQKNDMILSINEQMKSQVEKCNTVNQEKQSMNESLTSELEQYKERVKTLENKSKKICF
ncbi:hypothetical protein Tco_1022334 [Tanacetum coccineum]